MILIIEQDDSETASYASAMISNEVKIIFIVNFFKMATPKLLFCVNA